MKCIEDKTLEYKPDPASEEKQSIKFIDAIDILVKATEVNKYDDDIKKAWLVHAFDEFQSWYRLALPLAYNPWRFYRNATKKAFFKGTLKPWPQAPGEEEEKVETDETVNVGSTENK